MSSLAHSADCIGSIPGELVARLEVAEAGSLHFSWVVLLALGFKDISDRRDAVNTWSRTGRLDDAFTRDTVTTSLDAALALAERVLPGLGAWDIGHAYNAEPPYQARLVVVRQGDPETFARAATPALALCIAILKATATGKAGLAGYEAEGVVHPKTPSPEKQGEGL